MDKLITDHGAAIYIAQLTSNDVRWTDIATALAKQCIFGGHSRVFFSRAQFACMVAKQLDGEAKLAALLHEAPYAYLGAVEPYFIEAMAAFGLTADSYQRAFDRVMRAVAAAAGLAYPFNEILINSQLQAARRQVLASLRRDLLPDVSSGTDPYINYPKPKLQRPAADPWPTAMDEYLRALMVSLKLHNIKASKSEVA